jgi:hypothetical protein
MAGNRKRGPVCVSNVRETIDHGTLCRQPSPNPGPVGLHDLWELGAEAITWAAQKGAQAVHEIALIENDLLADHAASSPLSGPSGPQWISAFPTSNKTEDLVEPFRTDVTRLLSSLQTAHASVEIAATFRPPQRAYLMHFSFAIARENMDPRAVPGMSGVPIQWAHTDIHNHFDRKASKSAAEEMVLGYEIVYSPALRSRHTEGKAIDMTITWDASLVMVDGKGKKVTISTTPRNGAHNSQLHAVGASYGVVKLLSDAPHWSSDGH